jgi:carboxymethylenebutenolidase
MMALNLEQAAKDLSGAVDLLQERSGRSSIGVVGFCMGGGLALVVATQRPDAVKAAAPFYGVIPWPSAQPDWSALDAKVVGHYAELDGFFTPEMARDLEATLTGLGKEAEIVVHEGADHAFFNDERPEVYKEDCAREAWDSTLELFRATL